MIVSEEVELPIKPQIAWAILTEPSRYPEWISTFRLEGELRAGAEITYAFRGPRRRVFRMPVRVEEFEPNQCLRLRSNWGGLMQIDEAFTFTRTLKGVRLSHQFSCEGLLARILKRRISKNLSTWVLSFNKCLKAYATKVAAGQVRIRTAKLH